MLLEVPVSDAAGLDFGVDEVDLGDEWAPESGENDSLEPDFVEDEVIERVLDFPESLLTDVLLAPSNISDATD